MRCAPSGPIPKFVSCCRTLVYELRNLRTTSNSMILVPLLNPKFAIAFCRTMCANFGFGALVVRFTMCANFGFAALASPVSGYVPVRHASLQMPEPKGLLASTTSVALI